MHCYLDINSIFNYLQSNRQKASVLRFDQICLPGMTEDHRVSVFVHRDDFIDSQGSPSNQRIVFVSDDSNPDLLQEYERCSASIFDEFHSMQLTETIEKYERNMFVKISKAVSLMTLLDMKEVLNVIVCHTVLEQYSIFNFPLDDYEEYTPQHLRSLHEYE